MLPDDTQSKIKNITAGVILERKPDYCTATRNLLRGRYPTSTKFKKDFESQSIIKKEQAKQPEHFCKSNELWIESLPSGDKFLSIQYFTP